MKQSPLLLGILLCTSTVHAESPRTAKIDKPTGTYSSMLTERAAKHPEMQGALVRVMWADLEPNPGSYDFSDIESRLRLLPDGKKWTLAIYGGWTAHAKNAPAPTKRPAFARKPAMQRALKAHMSPPWLSSKLGAKTFVMHFRGTAVELPKYWDPVVQKRLALLMQAVGKKYNKDPRLMMVYVPQMTSNGLEGHFNGVPNETLLSAAGLKATESQKFAQQWSTAALAAISSTANAFPNKAVAYEVHELLGSTAAAKLIMQGILTDPKLKQQAGIAIWWLSGKTNYQADLISEVKKFPGDIYGQVIGRSNQAHRFPAEGYQAVFTQAKELGLRYIEPWNYEFEHHSHDALMKDFNHYAAKKFVPAAEKKK
ncbi:hypothetical protein JIN77_04365 [Verrucomicrobiaceae bacterium R5-34]|uniref:Uncharacterized protein n=1 Tax=Oceaniferula flava TaxID=2800421 RepID=A0AAE2SER2_9BACT|nr:hypothetical protein [Oceaniferula flavus]MBK1829947.1 hypothetical protein [Verrucomicrobiaceae bacterium R5-34]MBK1855205.1 hypothetical protein [Oceaniferula flavus]MBM1136511.1 hypothetical protein [Oceaniferula flavus]